MSGTDIVVAEAADICCASCGIAEVDDVKLKPCDGCDLVRYCSDECQEDHRPEHEILCKKRVAELRDEILFKQPEKTHLGDCPICCLPIPLDEEERPSYSCCSNKICQGCFQAKWSLGGGTIDSVSCPFCRHPVCTKEEADKNRMKRIEANDPVAFRHFGADLYAKGEYDAAFEFFTKAADLGHASAHYKLSEMYDKGLSIEKDEKKELFHLEEAAIAGHPDARYDLGIYEWNKDRYDRAVKHWIIAANLGEDESLKELKECYKDELVSKEDFAAALRAHHVAVKAMKSPQREAAAR